MGRTIESRIQQQAASAQYQRQSRTKESNARKRTRLQSSRNSKKLKRNAHHTDVGRTEANASAARIQEHVETSERNRVNQASQTQYEKPSSEVEDHIKFFKAIDAPLTAVCASCGECVSFQTTKKIRYDKDSDRFKILAGDGVVGRGLIDAGMYRQGGIELARICTRCSTSLKRKAMPRYCVASGFSLDSIPACLTVLNALEARMVGLGICFTTVFSLGYLGQTASRGNAISVWNSAYDIVHTLPRPPDRCGVVIVKIVGLQKPAVYYPVRPWLLREALHWLKQNNPLYQNVFIDEDLLNNMPTEPILPAVDLDPQDSVGAQATELDCNNSDEETSYESSFVMKSLNDGQLEDDKILEVLTGSQAERAYTLPVPGEPMNEFSTHHLMQACFPTLFPRGRGGFHPIDGEQRKDTFQLADYCAHLMAWHDRRFVMHPTFKFFCLNLIQRRQVDGLLKRLTLGKKQPERDSPQYEPSFRAIPASNTNFKTKEYLKELKPFFRSVRGTGLYWSNVRSDLKSLVGNPALENPWPTFFVTLSAADTVWPDFFRVCDPTLTLKDAANLTGSQRRRYLNANPDLAANHFQRRFMAFFTHILCGKSKPLGEIIDFFWRIEFQRRGSPHVHALLWIKGAPNILELSKSPEGIAVLREFADKFVSCLARFTESTTPSVASDPLCVRPPCFSEPEAWEHDLGQVVKRVQQHVCSARSSCQRNGKCRFGFPKALQSSTDVVRSENDGKITIKFKHARDKGTINNYNPIMLSVWRANMDIQIVGNAHGAAEYTAAYVSKAEPDSVRFQRTIEQALQKLPAGAPHSAFLRRTANALLGAREVSAQEAIYILSNTLCLYGKSRSIVNVKVSRHSQQYYHIDSVMERRADSCRIRIEPLERAYMQRPSSFEKLAYREFCELYELSAASPSLSQRLQRWELADGSGYIKARTQKQVVRPVPYIRPDEAMPNFCFAQLMMYRPWRKIEDLPEDDDEVLRAYHHWKSSSNSLWLSQIDETIQRDAALSAVSESPMRLSAPEWRIHLYETSAAVEPHQSTEFRSRFPYSQQDVQRAKTFMKNVIKPYVENGRVGDADYDSMPYTYPTDDQHKSMTTDQWSPFAMCMYQNRRRATALHAQNQQLCPQMQMVVTGEGGTGKSWLLHHIQQDVRVVFGAQRHVKRVLLMAHQGSAAHLIGGRTIVSALGLSSHTGSFRNQYVDLLHTFGGPATLRRLQHEYENVHLVIIDEFGVVSSGMLHWIDQRLREIFPQDSHLSFGGRDIIFTGDPGQLGPVRPTSLSVPTNIGLTDSEQRGRKLWMDIPLYFVLSQQNRGREDEGWYDMLRRVRDGTATGEDIKLINSRVSSRVGYNYEDQIVIAYRNHDVDTANMQALASLREPMINIMAHHDVKVSDRKIIKIDQPKLGQLLHQAKTLSCSRANHLAAQVNLAIGAKIVLTSNIEQQAGLCNGTRGVVYDIMYDDECDLPILLVKIGSYRGPSFIDNVAGVVPITCQTAALTVDKLCQYKFSRTALPVRLGFATTIHKIQGQTCARVIFNPTAMNSSALAYVALSRVRSREDISLTAPLTPKQLEVSAKARAIDEAETARLQPVLSCSLKQARALVPLMQVIARDYNNRASLQ